MIGIPLKVYQLDDSLDSIHNLAVYLRILLCIVRHVKSPRDKIIIASQFEKYGYGSKITS